MGNNGDSHKDEKWVLLRIREAGRNYFGKAPDGIELKVGDYCIVEVDRAEDYAKILCDKRVPTEDEKKNTIVKRIKRMLTDKDIERIEDNKKKAHQAYLKCLRRIEDHKLEMKLVDVEYSFDGSRIVFYFTAEGRVDFRELVKTLASEFRARIELRQIGVRDESSIIGGIASCGRRLCCCSFLYEFEPVTIKMAKDQRLPLNPSKISGICGRLLCCLRYEYKFYKKMAKTMPRENALVSTKLGQGRVVDLNVLKRTVIVELENQNNAEFSIDEVKIIKDQVAPKVSSKTGQDVDEKELAKLEDIPGSSFSDEDDEDNDED